MKFNTQYSQAHQDIFAHRLSGINGTYIEIGGNDPKRMSNTYNLEVYAGWKGFSIELDPSYKEQWQNCPERTNPIFWENAITFDYVSAVKQLNMPSRINFLSCDIEPPRNTFAALQAVIEQGISFDYISFEHDRYRESEDFDKIARDYLIPKGYKVAISEVFYKKKATTKKERIYETWFVNQDVNFQELSYHSWLGSI